MIGFFWIGGMRSDLPLRAVLYACVVGAYAVLKENHFNECVLNECRLKEWLTSWTGLFTNTTQFDSWKQQCSYQGQQPGTCVTVCVPACLVKGDFTFGFIKIACTVFCLLFSIYLFVVCVQLLLLATKKVAMYVVCVIKHDWLEPQTKVSS
jgi:hypothetical protein